MSRVVWDAIGEKFYETGIDRGVLYVENGIGVAWNGLVGVNEQFSEETNTPLYRDGIKDFDLQTFGDYQAVLKALTYPDEFLECEGYRVMGGLLADGQAPKNFSLSYRSLIGDDVEGHERGYKLHILYNLTAIPSPISYDTLTSSSVSPIEFSWDLTSVPELVPGYRPTGHVIIDSRYVNEILLGELENLLYGTDNTDPELPIISDLVEWIDQWRKLVITDHNNGLWTASDTGDEDHYVKMVDATTFEIDSPTVVFLDDDTYEVSDHAFGE